MPKDVDHEQRRRELGEALWRVVEREGVERVTVRRIAAEGGVSVGMVQHYFADKDEILWFALYSELERSHAQLERRLASIDVDDPQEAIRSILRARLPLTARQRRHARVLMAWVSQWGSERRIHDVLQERQRPAEQLLREHIESAQVRGKLDAAINAVALAHGLYAIVDGLMISFLYGLETRASVLGVIDAHVDALFARR